MLKSAFQPLFSFFRHPTHMRKADIRGQKGLTRAQAKALAREFRAQHPQIWKRWVELEAASQGITEVYRLIEEFLQEHCISENLTDRTYAMFNLRGVAHEVATGRRYKPPPLRPRDRANLRIALLCIAIVVLSFAFTLLR